MAKRLFKLGASHGLKVRCLRLNDVFTINRQQTNFVPERMEVMLRLSEFSGVAGQEPNDVVHDFSIHAEPMTMTLKLACSPVFWSIV